jgi:hypothetical protein
MKTRQDADSEESKNIDVEIHEQYRLLKPEQWEQIKPAFEAVQGSWINAPFKVRILSESVSKLYVDDMAQGSVFATPEKQKCKVIHRWINLKLAVYTDQEITGNAMGEYIEEHQASEITIDWTEAAEWDSALFYPI